MSVQRLKLIGASFLAGTVALSPVMAQVTSGSVTVLPGGAPEYRAGPVVDEERVPDDWVPPPQRPTSPGRVMVTTPVGDEPTPVAPNTQLGPSTAPTRDSADDNQSLPRGYRQQAVTVLGEPVPEPTRQAEPSERVVTPQRPADVEVLTEIEIADERESPTPVPAPEPSPTVIAQPLPPAESEAPIVAEPAPQLESEARGLAEPEPQPEAQPVPESPAIAEPAPRAESETVVTVEPAPETEPEPVIDPEVASEPPAAMEPEPAPAPEPPVVAEPDMPRWRFDELPSEGAHIEAYDDLLASGVEAANEFEAIDGLAALQLREWMAQMRSAVEDHPSVRVAQLQAQASEAGVDQARSARLPQITLSSEVGSDRAVRDGEEQDGITGARDDLQITPTLDASLLLFDAGATRAGIEAAERRVEAGDVAAEAASDTIAFRAAQTLIDLATLRAQIRLAEENLNEVRRLRAMIQERAEAGRDSPSDMFRMDSRVQEARNTLEQRVAQFNAARANYAEVFRSDPIVLGLPPAYAPVPASARSAIDRAVQRNPQIRQAEALAQAAQRDFEARRAALWPQLSLGASVTGYDVTREGEDFYDSFIGLRLNAPLFDGGGRRAQIEQAQQQANLEQARVDELRANIVRSLSEAYSGRASLRPRLESIEDQVTANRATLEAYEEQFFTGRRPLNDLVTAQRELYTSRAELLDVQGELHLQHFTIRRLTGDLLSNYGLPEGRE